MAYIIRNNVKYAGGSGSGGGDNAIECTMAEYEAFEAQGKVIPNTTYYITDYTENENISLDASNVVFDDTDTQIGVDNVQDAIEKLNTNIDEQNKNITPVLVEGIEYYDSAYLISSAGKISVTLKEIKFNMSCSINAIPDATNIFSTAVGYFGWLNIIEPSTGKTYLLHSNATGFISAWGAIPAIVNGVITGTLFKL